MIGLRVKACFCALIVMSAGACSAKPKASQTVVPTAPSIPAGAERWQGGALLLPAGSPAVFSGRLDVVLDAVTRLKAWIVAEPAMLGPDGPEMARTIESGWVAATAYVGVDPLLPQAWVARGVDPSRRFYVGMYPVLHDGRRFISSVETVIREELGVAPGVSVSDSVHALSAAKGELPEGTHARILRALEDTKPIGGVRVVIPVSDPTEFLITASSFAEGMGFRPFGALREGAEHMFWSDGGEVPAMSVRFASGFAVLDLLFPSFLGRPRTVFDPKVDLEIVQAELGRALVEIPPGRPRAPAPIGSPAVSVSFDQAQMSELVRMRGYWRSLEDLQSTGTGRRDAELLNALAAALSESDAWTVAADELTGTSFQLSVQPTGSRVLGNLQMSMFARRGLSELDTSRQVPTLDLSRRSAGVGVDLAALKTPEWRSWFGSETAAEFNSLHFSTMRTTHTLLPGLRAGAVAISNLGDTSGATISQSLSETLGEFEHVQRFEVVGLAPDVSQMQQRPEILCAVVLDPHAPPDAVADLQAALATLLLGWIEPGALVPPLAPLTPGVTSEISLGDLEIRQQVIDGSKHRVVLFGVGVGEEAFAVEAAPLQKASPVHGVIQGRLEPIALLSWLRDGDAKLFDPIDVDILAQRLGALTLSYQSAQADESASMTVDLQLESPPSL